jgi:hypothetical protein
MNDTRLNKIKDKISNKLDPNILTKIKNVSSDIYDSLSISSKMNENNSMNIIDLYYKILHDLRIMNDDDRLNQSMRSNVSMVQSLIADDLIERFNLEKKNVRNNNNGLGGITKKIGNLMLEKNKNNVGNTNKRVDALEEMLEKLLKL